MRAVAKYHQEQEAKEVKAEREEVQKLKRIAGNIAKEIKSFWTNIEKVRFLPSIKKFHHFHVNVNTISEKCKVTLSTLPKSNSLGLKKKA